MLIAAFNVQKLGWRKVNNPEVRENLIRIISRYSVVVMLEVVDSSGKAMDKLLTELNNSRGNIQHPYAMKKSRRLGRSTYMEQFVYFYKEEEVELVKSYQYVERHEDIIAREPFILWFRCPNTVMQDLVLIPVHTKPEDTERELNALDDVVEDVKRRWEISNIMILGDFNADGRYLRRSRRQNIRILKHPYLWLIDEDADTTTSDLNDHTYDRIVVYGDDMYQAIVEGSAKPFDFQEAYGLSEDTTRAISDHYPVEVELVEEEEEEDEDEEDEDEEDEDEEDEEVSRERQETGGREGGMTWLLRAGPILHVVTCNEVCSLNTWEWCSTP